ncbi:MAG: HAMP domain-containing sensor histidine kinase [Eubacteriales bacterium]|nr:HAMP domain-containing sensor histidine kinase [Eubacteriales bacterium]
MKHRFSMHSLYGRTILQLAMAILVVFSVMGVFYYGIVTTASARQQSNQLLGSTQAIAEVVGPSFNASRGEITSSQVISYLNFTARSTGALVWVIDRQGNFAFMTNTPVTLTESFELIDEQWNLPDTYRGGADLGTSGRSSIGDFSGLFRSTGQRWISTTVPLPSPTGAYIGEIQLHRPVVTESFNSFLMANSLLLSMLVAFILALFFLGLLSRNITRPIRLLAQTADRVYRGDLTARVKLSGFSGSSQPSKPALVTDDLMILVETMNSMIEKLENQERTRRDFISSVTHDLRTPLTSVRGFVEGILDGTVPEEKIGTYLDIVRQEVMRLQTMVNTLSEASRFDSGTVQLDQTVFDIYALLKEDVYGLESLLNEKNISVQTDFESSEQDRLLVVGDRAAISRVVYNIISNAIRYTPVDGIISLTTRRNNRTHLIEIVIEDSGPGISSAEWPFIFDRFYTVDKSRTGKSSGLGLFICRTILAAHGQRITVSNSELGGACFTFTLAMP